MFSLIPSAATDKQSQSLLTKACSCGAIGRKTKTTLNDRPQTQKNIERNIDTHTDTHRHTHTDAATLDNNAGGKAHFRGPYGT